MISSLRIHHFVFAFSLLFTFAAVGCGGAGEIEDQATSSDNLCIDWDTGQIDWTRTCPLTPPGAGNGGSNSGSVSRCNTTTSINGASKQAICEKEGNQPAECTCKVNNRVVATCSQSGNSLQCPGCCNDFF